MKETVLKITIIVFLISILQCCINLNHKSNCENEKFMLNKEIVLLKTIPGGSRSHIIVLSKDGSLKYSIGSITSMDTFNEKNFQLDKRYLEKTFNLNKTKMEATNLLIASSEKLFYYDSVVVKDNMQYLIYFDADKKLFGYEKNFDSYPDNWKQLIAFILNEVGELYKIPGMS